MLAVTATGIAQAAIDASITYARNRHQFGHPIASFQMIQEMLADDGFSTSQSGIWIQRYRYHAWWHNSLTSEDQLRQRVAWALIQILVTSESGDGFNDENPGNVSGKGR